MNLYNINIKFKDAFDRLERAETEAEYYAAEVELSALDIAKDEKLEACCAYLKNLRADEDVIKGEIVRLQTKLDDARKMSDKFEDYLTACLTPGDKWTRGAHSIGWRKSKRVIVISEEEIPSAYKVEHISYTPDKALLKADLECGATIPGAELKEYQNIQIK